MNTTNARLLSRSAVVLSVLFALLPTVALGQSTSPPRRPMLAVFAHPDDERVIGPMLSRFGREGRELHLVIATDGSKGVREHAGIPAGKPLAAERAKEAQCATKRLGVRELHMLGLEDGGLASFEALGRLRNELARL